MKPILITCQEIWKDLESFPGYQVSTLGSVKSVNRFRKTKGNYLAKVKGRNLTIRKNKRGYLECRIKNIDKVIHRLVAQTFLSNIENKPQVNHIDGNKTNNKLYNLEWVTGSENQKHAIKLGLKPSVKEENNPNTHLTNEEVSNIKELYNNGKSIANLSVTFKINIEIIRSIVYGNSWKNILPIIIKRDDRNIRTKESINKNLISRYNNKIKCSSIIVESLDAFGNKTIYKSISDASFITKIPRKTIEYALKNNKSIKGLTWIKNTTKTLEEIL